MKLSINDCKAYGSKEWTRILTLWAWVHKTEISEYDSFQNKQTNQKYSQVTVVTFHSAFCTYSRV